MDEPLKGLDPIGIKEMRELFIALSKEKGMTIFLLTETFFALCKDTLTLQIIMYAFLSLIVYSGTAGLIGVISVWFGFLKKSIAATIVSSCIIVSVVCQAAAQLVMLPQFFIPALIGITLTGIVIASFVYRNLHYRIEKMEI